MHQPDHLAITHDDVAALAATAADLYDEGYEEDAALCAAAALMLAEELMEGAE